MALDLINNYKSQLPSWMQSNSRWDDLFYAIIKVLSNYLDDTTIYLLENSYDPELIDFDYVNRLYELFQWKYNRETDVTEEDIRTELLSLWQWNRDKTLISTYYSIFYSLGLDVDFYVLWTKNFIDFIPTTWEFLHTDLKMDVGLYLDMEENLLMDNLYPTPHMKFVLNCTTILDTGNFFDLREIETLKARLKQIAPIQSILYIETTLETIIPSGETDYTDDKSIRTIKSTEYQSLEIGNLYFLAEITNRVRIGFGNIIDNDYIEINNIERKYNETNNQIEYSGSYLRAGTEKYIEYYIFYNIYDEELLRITFPGIYINDEIENSFKIILQY